jgi:hypothetical protein
MRPIAVVAYIVLLAPALQMAAVVWDHVAVNAMFNCADSLGVPRDFIPPFVHTAKDTRDHYISSPWLVYLLWLVLLGGAITLPWFALAAVSRILSTFMRVTAADR